MADTGVARLMRGGAITLVFALSPLYAGATTSEESEASAPPQIRSLRCGDLTTAGSDDTLQSSILQWLDGMITPVAGGGVGTNQVYAQVLRECGQEPGRMVLDVVLELRGVLRGLDRPNR
jgi:hypothetical protein